MADEPDNSWRVRQSVTAALPVALLLLLALALFAGCKSFPAKAVDLRVDDDAAVFIQWTQEGTQIKGTIDMVGRTPDNEITTFLAVYDGVLDGEKFSMITKSVRTSQEEDEKPGEKIIGRLKGGTLTLFIDEGDSEPKEFRRAAPAEFAEASQNLQMRAKMNKGAY